jgi:hypothetical protein
MIRRSTSRRHLAIALGAALTAPLALTRCAPSAAAAEGTAPMKHNLEQGAGAERGVSTPADRPAQMPVGMEDLHSVLRWTRERNRPYAAPRPDELGRFLTAAQALFKEVREGRCHRSLPFFKEAGFEVSLTSLGGKPAFAVREQPWLRRGGGVYIIRHGAVPRERIVQVPHSFFDVGTMEIGIDLANAAQARALYVSTVHRYQGGKPPPADGEEHAASPADLTHQEATFFQRLTDGALAVLPRLQVIQVHGFGDGKVPECAQAAVVVSPGTAPAGAPEAAHVAARLAALFGPDRVLLYPRDTQKYGAQTNVQSHAVAANRTATFLHLELSRTLRTRLLSDIALRRAFIAAVLGPGGEKP